MNNTLWESIPSDWYSLPIELTAEIFELCDPADFYAVCLADKRPWKADPELLARFRGRYLVEHDEIFNSLRSIYTTYQGKKHGKYEDYHYNGQPWEHRFYRNDKRHGESKKWYPNGQLKMHSFYKRGKFHGEHKTWHPCGIPHIECSHKHGRCHGEFKKWNMEGNLIVHLIYNDGILIKIVLSMFQF